MKNLLMDSTQLEWLQRVLDALMGMFGQVELRMVVSKTLEILC